MADLIGPDALSRTDRQYVTYQEAFERDLLDQGREENRALDDTLDRAWQVLGTLPRRELTMLPTTLLEQRLPRSAR